MPTTMTEAEAGRVNLRRTRSATFQQARVDRQRRDRDNATSRLASAGQVNYRTATAPLTMNEVDRRRAALLASR